jgi:hypothetical protein
VSRTHLVSWLGPRAIVTRTGREPGKPSIDSRFAGLVEETLNERYENMTYGVEFSSDWRMGGPHWWEGWRTLVRAERFDEPWAILGLKTQEAGAQFTRTTLQMENALSWGRDPRPVRFMGRIVDTGVSSHADRMEIADLALLGGREGLGGFQAGRFHDFDLILGRVTYLIPLVRRLELDLHVESGGVYSDLWKSARFDQLEQSAGFAIRGRTNERPMGSIGMDFCREGARLRYTFGNPDR